MIVPALFTVAISVLAAFTVSWTIGEQSVRAAEATARRRTTLADGIDIEPLRKRQKAAELSRNLVLIASIGSVLASGASFPIPLLPVLVMLSIASYVAGRCHPLSAICLLVSGYWNSLVVVIINWIVVDLIRSSFDLGKVKRPDEEEKIAYEAAVKTRMALDVVTDTAMFCACVSMGLGSAPADTLLSAILVFTLSSSTADRWV
jgi:hypothetical protein